MKLTPTLLLLFFTSISSCDFPKYYFTPEPECESENQKMPIAQLQSKQPKDYRYFFKTFIEEGTKTYMITNFRNEEACFDIKILVDKWDKLAGMKRTNGYSYPKELYDLKWKIVTFKGEETVKYVDMHEIID